MSAEKAVQVQKLSADNYAKEFLLGSLIKASSKQFKAMSKPYAWLTEHEKEKLMREIADDCTEAVRQAIDIIAGNGRVVFAATVDQVTFKEGVKAVLKLGKTTEAHKLADAAGLSVMVVIEDRHKLLSMGDSTDIDKDQKPLFDASQEGGAE